MSATTTHTPSDLTFVDGDDRTGIVHFVARSASRPGTVHTVGLDTTTGETICTCRAAECGQRCWHRERVAAAWAAHPIRLAVADYSAVELQRVGAGARNHCRVYRRRGWRVPLADRLALVACREEYRARRAGAVAVAA